MTEPSKAKKSPRASGRPARLSRERILDTALILLRETNGKDVSIRRLAHRLEMVPGNLYTYFPNKEALLDALAEYALKSLEIAPSDATLPWDQQIARWMTAFRHTLQQRPELALIMGLAGTSPSTVARMGRIARLMQDQGMDAASAVLNAQGLLWTVMNHTLLEMRAQSEEVIEQLRLHASDEKNEEVLQHLAVENLEPLWQATLERNLDGIRYQVGRGGRATKGAEGPRKHS
jgi:AcrR family transcriptional regulator